MCEYTEATGIDKVVFFSFLKKWMMMDASIFCISRDMICHFGNLSRTNYLHPVENLMPDEPTT